MRFKIITTSLFLISLLLTSCSPQTKKNVENTNINISIQDTPSAEELKEWNVNDIYKLKSQIELIPLDSCEEYFTNAANEFLNKFENVELDSITIEQDNLSVIAGKNKKSLYNLDFEVNVVIDTTNNVGSYEFADDISNELLTFFEQYAYFVLKTKEIDINTFDLNHYKIHNVNSIYSIMNETVFVEQSEDEYAVQTLAFNFTDTNPDLALQKFGIISETNELYIEYLVNDDYFDGNKPEEKIACLEKLSIDLKEHLIMQNITKEFILSNDINLLTISFNNGILDGSYLTFNFEL